MIAASITFVSYERVVRMRRESPVVAVVEYGGGCGGDIGIVWWLIVFTCVVKSV